MRGRPFQRPSPESIEQKVLAALLHGSATPGRLFERMERLFGNVPSGAPSALFRLLDRGAVWRNGIVWGRYSMARGLR